MNTAKHAFCVFVAILIASVLLPHPAAAQVAPEKQTVLDWLSQPETVTKFGRISDSIWSYAELGLQEHKSSALLIRTLKDAGFKVEEGLAGMPTCFVATHGSGKPVVGILVEYDALPMLSQKGRATKHDPVVAGAPGHGCGHNLMASAATAAAIAVKKAMEKHSLTGTIKLFGSPAEEILVSRPYMVRAGLFKGVDAVINNHSGTGFQTAYGVSGTAMISATFRFQGKTAHSGSAPWSGRSALDAVEIMNVAANYLREHLHFSARMHYVIPDGGEAPNVVPDRACVWYFMRNSDDRLEEMYQRVLNCAKGAALATGTELAEARVLAAAHQSHHNKALAELMMKNIELVGMPQWTEQENAFARALQKELGCATNGMPVKIGAMGKTGRRVYGRSLLRPWRCDARSPHRDHWFPRPCQWRAGASLVHRGIRFRLYRVEGRQCRRKSHGSLRNRPAHQARRVAGDTKGIRRVFQNSSLQVFPAGRCQTAA